jgi:dTDP-glucose 4,6-dehydratase
MSLGDRRAESASPARALTFLLTGADGFVGAHILDHLLTVTTAHVICMVRSTPRRLPLILAGHDSSRVTIVQHDLLNPIPESLIGHVDVVISAASSTDIAGSIADPRRVFLPNLAAIANLAEWARLRDLEAFVQISTEEVYGPAPDEPHQEWEPIRPSTHYSASKAAQESYLIASWRSHGLPLVILNSMNLIGPTQAPSKLIPTVLRKLLGSEPVPLVVDWYEPQSGSGEESLRQYMHPRVLASAILAAIPEARPFNGDPFPARFNVAGTQIGNVALAHMISDVSGLPLKWVPLQADHARPGHEKVFALDDSKLRALGWEPPTSLAEDVRDTVEWMLANPEWLTDDIVVPRVPLLPERASSS